MKQQKRVPPRPEDFEDENGNVDWISYYEEAEEYELQRDGLR